MGRFIGIDYGSKRTGIAISDDLAFIATPLLSIHTSELDECLMKLVGKGDVRGLVFGLPVSLRGGDTDVTDKVRQISVHYKRLFSGIEIHFEDERFTSKIAQRSMLEGGLRKKKRGEPGMTDKVSAAIILQAFLDRLSSNRKKSG